MDTNDYTKESIKNRMFRRAASLWEVKDIDNLDPIVRLMIEALAGEVFDLSGTLQEVENRLLDKIANDLTPEVLISAKPAHGIMVATPLQNEAIVNNQTEFHYRNPDEIKHSNVKRLIYSPLKNVRLINGEVKCIIAGGDYYAIGKRSIKEKTARPLRYTADLEECMWIGIDLNSTIKDLKDLTLYFDFPYIEDKTELFKLLPFVKWSIGDKPIEMKQGIYRPESEKSTHSQRTFGSYNVTYRIEDEIDTFYEPRFLTVCQSFKIDGNDSKQLFPTEIADHFDAKVVSAETKPLIWLKAHFPPHMGKKVIKDIFVGINAFPVTNRFMIKTTHQISQLSSFVLLQKEQSEYFLAIDSITDENGLSYQESSLINTNNSSTGLYALRRGGAEKFSNSDVQNYLSRLISLLRDESIAFSKAEKDVLNENTNVLLKRINHLDQKIGRSTSKHETPTYLMLEHNLPQALRIDIAYWLTNGPAANGIGSSDRVIFTNDIDIDVTSATMLTKVRGGALPPDVTERTRMFKNALISRDSIYSNSDIVSFCMAKYGTLFSDVSVSKGYATNPAPSQGIVRTLDIAIKLRDVSNTTELVEIKEDLIANLKLRAPDDFNFRVFFNN